MSTGTSEDCRDCRAGWPHCHGTLIRHGAGGCQCTEPDCGYAEVFVHTLSIDCDAVGCPCGEGDLLSAAI